MESANTTMVPMYTWMAKSNATHQFTSALNIYINIIITKLLSYTQYRRHIAQKCKCA